MKYIYQIKAIIARINVEIALRRMATARGAEACFAGARRAMKAEIEARRAEERVLIARREQKPGAINARDLVVINTGDHASVGREVQSLVDEVNKLAGSP